MPISNIIPNAKALIAMRTDPDNRPELNRALDYVKGQLEGFTVECFERSGATSILAYRGDVRPEKFKIILNGHLDVIPGKDWQYEARVEGDRMYGVGSMDMKTNDCVMLEVFRDMADKVPYPLGLQIVTDEEIMGFNGTGYQVEEGVKADFVIAGETTQFDIVSKSRGILEFKVTAHGTTAHGAYPWRSAGCGDFDLIGDRRPVSYWRQIVWGLRKEPYLAVQDPGVTAAVGSVRPVPPPSYEEAVRAHEPEIAGTLPPCPPREVVSTPSEKEAALTGGENLPHEDERLLTGNDSAASLADIEKTEQTVEEIKASTESFLLPDYRIIGELFDTYIMIESGSELILIDKHAAHERLNYERLMAQRQHPESQMLLTPLPVTLDKQQYDAVTDNIGLLAEAGFEVEDFGMGTVLVRSVPTILSGSDAEGAFLEIAGYLGSRLYAATTDHIDWIYHTISCKSAIKGGDKNLPAELTELVLTLMHHPDVRYCPHGRPIYISLKQREIEKYFGRIQS